MDEKTTSTLPSDLTECLDRLVEDNYVRTSHGLFNLGSSSQLRDTGYVADKYDPDDPNPPLVRHPLIAFILAIPRNTYQKKSITVKNGGYEIKIGQGDIVRAKENDWLDYEPLLLPCCKQSRAFCILLLRELTYLKEDNYKIQLGSNLVTIAEGLGIGRSGNKDKQGFADHIARVAQCKYKSRNFGTFVKEDDMYRFSFGQAIKADLHEVRNVFDHSVFHNYISMLDVDFMKNLGTTYALDFFLFCIDKLIFNHEQKSELVTWDQLYILNGWSLSKKEKYVEEMRKASGKVMEHFPQLKMTRSGLRFFPN